MSQYMPNLLLDLFSSQIGGITWVVPIYQFDNGKIKK